LLILKVSLLADAKFKDILPEIISFAHAITFLEKMNSSINF